MFNEGHKATILVRKGSGCAQYKAYYLKLTSQKSGPFLASVLRQEDTELCAKVGDGMKG
jgi:hypothetical protein